ncbi:hypothetical protein SteCoe_31610 [Stentor coeruleus]|uniref:GOLD domain-containing protein n=1 Tax=Stentor coeruleus TaxID=5963 RepID=A0A1R2B0W0_9CILI|nr:hypothetical protein SteCoe_31610 [Stentor coeruleus]
MKILLIISSCLGVFFMLPGYMEYCFSIEGKASRKIYGAYVISGLGDMNVLTRFFNSQSKAKYLSPKNTREGKFETVLNIDEMHELCFKSLDNEVKTISFEFSQDEYIQEQSLAGEDQFQPINDEVSLASKLLETIYRNLHFYERRERTHRDLTENTCDNILLSVLIKILVLCFLSFIQLYVLIRLINTNKLGV